MAALAPSAHVPNPSEAVSAEQRETGPMTVDFLVNKRPKLTSLLAPFLEPYQGQVKGQSPENETLCFYRYTIYQTFDKA